MSRKCNSPEVFPVFSSVFSSFLVAFSAVFMRIFRKFLVKVHMLQRLTPGLLQKNVKKSITVRE